MTVQANVEALNVARAALKAHCMALRVKEESDRVIVTFPYGYSADGAQCRFKAQGVSKKEAYELLLGACERAWQRG